MRYFVAHLLGGEAKAFHEHLTHELSSTFHTVPLHARIPPHITVKPPFETDDVGVEEVERVLRAFSHSKIAAPLTLTGFGRFGFRTIYMDVVKSSAAVDLIRKAVGTLNAHIPWMPPYPLEGNKLHASVARFLTRRQHRHIWRYLEGKEETFYSNVDNLAILKKVNKSWQVHALVPLRPEIGDAFSGFPSTSLGKNSRKIENSISP